MEFCLLFGICNNCNENKAGWRYSKDRNYMNKKSSHITVAAKGGVMKIYEKVLSNTVWGTVALI
jgi:hypothetical protein